MGEKLNITLGCGFAILMMAFGVIQTVAGWVGIAHSFGSGWAVAAVVAAIFFRFTIPLVVGAFLCAKNIWDWHWILAALFASPGLLIMVPAVFASILAVFASIIGAVKR